MIYTVTGTVRKADFGKACVHEHICVVSNDMRHTFGTSWFDRERVISLATDVLKKSGFGLFVDGTPCDLGRDVSILKAVSEKSGVKIVASTGFYYYPDLFTVNRAPIELANWIIKECRDGMEGTDIKPGMLKCASNGSELSNDAKKRLSAMAIVQKETGLSMYVHCCHGGDAMDAINVLTESGANPEKLIIGHCGLNPDSDYLEGILSKGCYIAMDQNYCSRRKEEIPKALTQLCKKGYVERICLSSDHCIYSDFTDGENTGMSKTVEEHLAILDYQQEKIHSLFEGSKEDWDKMMGQNIIDILDI